MALFSLLKGTAQVKRGRWVCRSKADSSTRAGDPQPPRKAACWVLAGLRTELVPAPMPAGRPLQVSAEPSRVDGKARSIWCVCESANTENGNPWEAKEIQILPSKLAFPPSPLPCPPPRSAAYKFTPGSPPFKPNRKKAEFCLVRHTSSGKHWQGSLIPSQGCGGENSTKSASEWLRRQNSPAEPAPGRNLKSEAFLFYSFLFLSF